ncbi:MAG: Hpt domain-containing protein [Gloeomargarita sp. SKYG116]|nr:Hpt domain-containing protein [Gloeomargarita sp. SKYG116]MCS7226864.1 Hpt domain-containing protein [Gloeomargarita sp. SKYB31]MDW8401928.1 Hpt domain-containing protein [Gloeomargarita sp. SKYGB_i_bin116]
METDRQPLINRDFLQTTFGDDPEFIQELLQLYVQDAQARLAALQQASVSLNWGQIQHEAHQLKGASANVGATAIQNLARTLEELAAAQQEPERVRELIQTLAQSVQQIKREVGVNV